MKVFSSTSALFLVSMTTVQAVPIPVTEHLESFFKAIQGFVDPIFLPKNPKPSALESKIHTTNLPLTAPTEVQMLEPGVGVPAHKKTHRKTSKIHTTNMLSMEPAEIQMLQPVRGVSVRPRVLMKKVPKSERELELELFIAKLNAVHDAMESTTGKGRSTIGEVNEMWKKKIDEVDTPLKAKSVAFGPEVTTHDSSSLLKLENDLELVQLNAIESAQEATAGRKQHTIDEVNEIWKLKTSEDVNPLRANKLTFSPSSE